MPTVPIELSVANGADLAACFSIGKSQFLELAAVLRSIGVQVIFTSDDISDDLLYLLSTADLLLVLFFLHLCPLPLFPAL